jgi:hypothetical protein
VKGGGKKGKGQKCAAGADSVWNLKRKSKFWWK